MKSLNKSLRDELERSIDAIDDDLERLKQRAILLLDREAANELLGQATEAVRHFVPILLAHPELLADAAALRFDMPVLIALSRSHRHYHKRILDCVRISTLGSKTGVACGERANWKSDNPVGAWAVDLYNTVLGLRSGDTPNSNPLVTLYITVIKARHPEIVSEARSLPATSKPDEWTPVCAKILYVLRPELQPMPRGKRKAGDIRRADPRLRKERNAILARIRSMAAGPDKGHTWLKRLP